MALIYNRQDPSWYCVEQDNQGLHAALQVNESYHVLDSQVWIHAWLTIEVKVEGFLASNRKGYREVRRRLFRSQMQGICIITRDEMASSSGTWASGSIGKSRT
jgi:hypothetical protein